MVAVEHANVVLGAQRGNRKSHGNAVIMKGVDGAATEVTAFDDNAVVSTSLTTPRVAALCHGGDTVALFDPQFLGTSQDSAPMGTGSGDKQRRELIDRQRHLLSGNSMPCSGA